MKSFLEIIGRDFSHLRDALFPIAGLESASLVCDGRRGEGRRSSSQDAKAWSVYVQRGQISLARLGKKPESGQHGCQE